MGGSRDVAKSAKTRLSNIILPWDFYERVALSSQESGNVPHFGLKSSNPLSQVKYARVIIFAIRIYRERFHCRQL